MKVSPRGQSRTERHRVLTAIEVKKRQTDTSEMYVGEPKGIIVTPIGTDVKMDEWRQVRRPVPQTAYEIATRYRRYSPKAHVTPSPPLRLRRWPTRFNDLKKQSSSGVSTSGQLCYDRDNFPDDFDYDEEEEGSERPPELTSSQDIYQQACKTLHLVPSGIVTRNICLSTLDLRNQLLGNQGVRALCIALMKNTTVTSINLMGNNIGIEGSCCIAQVLNSNTFIRELNLANNRMGRKGVCYVVNIIRELDMINSLNLSGNNLQENDGIMIRNLIEDCTQLKVLNVSHNYFRETGGVEIGYAVDGFGSLEVLDLSWNHLRRHGARAIACGVGNSFSLREVNLAWNGFHLDGSKEMGKALEKSSSLRVLDLSGNRIDEVCLGELINGLKNNSTLMVLKLAHNPFTTNDVHFLLHTLYNLTTSHVTELDLGGLCVAGQSLQLLKELTRERDIKIQHGALLGKEVDIRNYEQELLNENPLMVLHQYGHLVGLSLMNFFNLMSGKDKNSLTIADIKRELLKIKIPLREKAVDKFAASIFDLSDVKQLDEYTKIVEVFLVSIRRQSDRVYTRLLTREILEQTEETRVRAKLKSLIHRQDKEKQQDKLKRCSLSTQSLASVNKTSKEGLANLNEDEITLLQDNESITLFPPLEGEVSL